MLTPEAIAALQHAPRHERARRLLTGELGPLFTCPLEPHVAAVAYLVYLAWIRARVPGHMLAGRPGYEAAETLRSRVATAARRSGDLRGFAHELFRRLHLSLGELTTADALWWRAAELSHARRWRDFDALTLTETATGARLLDELLRLIPDPPKTDAAEAIEETTDAQ